METIVVKFGGSSLADAAQIRKAAAIIRSDPRRRFVVASAPGKRSSDDTKVTDLLYRCYDLAAAGEDFEPILQQIEQRFSGIVKQLGVDFDLDTEIAAIRAHLSGVPSRDYMASRGEYLNSRILSVFLDFPFVEPAEYLHFDANGVFHAEATQCSLSGALSRLSCAVIPGFYGSLPDGRIHTFSRGGSDLTGSIVARAAQADCYENWTDVSGMLAADPRIVSEPHTIAYVTYKELRELSYMGASVLHEDAVFPVRMAGIPINIRNTNEPGHPGTLIVPQLPENVSSRIVTGVAGRKGFSSIHVEQSMMNGEVGFGARLLDILAAHGVPFEHCPTGIDTMSVIVSSEELHREQSSIEAEIRAQLDPEVLYVEDSLAMIAVVGQGMRRYKGIAARIFGAVAEAGINIRMIDQGSSELNIIIGVEEADYAKAIDSIYRAVENLM